MSWVFGFTGTSLSPALRERLVALHDAPLHRAESPTLYVRAGGLRETCFGGRLPEEPDGGWLVVGLGIERHEKHCTFLDAAAWQQRLAQPTPDFGGLDGHFVALRWRPGRVEAFTDVLGTRTLYLAELPGGTAFSTRLDWLAALCGGEIDFEAFGTHYFRKTIQNPKSKIQNRRRYRSRLRSGSADDGGCRLRGALRRCQ